MVIAGGSVYNSATSAITQRDVFVEGSRVVEGFDESGADLVIDAAGLLVTPGWVDLHTHVFRGQETGIDPELVGPATGVTTMIDAGSAGAHLYEAFAATTLRDSIPRIRAFLNISTIGTTSILLAGELRQIDYIDEHACIDCVRRHPGQIIGIKVRASANVGAENTREALRRARRAADDVGLPLMVHVGPAPATISEVLAVLRPGDIMTHCFSGATDVPIARVDREEQLLDESLDAQRRGVIFDVGHGMGSFDARRVSAALNAGFLPNTISTDVWAHAPSPLKTGGLPHVANMMLALGLALEDTLARVTAAPAKAAGLDTIGVGSLQPGSPADIALFRLEHGPAEFEDPQGFRFSGDRSLKPMMTVQGGTVVFDERKAR